MGMCIPVPYLVFDIPYCVILVYANGKCSPFLGSSCSSNPFRLSLAVRYYRSSWLGSLPTSRSPRRGARRITEGWAFDIGVVNVNDISIRLGNFRRRRRLLRPAIQPWKSFPISQTVNGDIGLLVVRKPLWGF